MVSVPEDIHDDGILTAADREMSDGTIEAVILPPTALPIVKAKSFRISPWDIEKDSDLSNPQPSTRKPRKKLQSELLTLDSNFKLMSAVYKNKLKTSSDSGDRRSTCSLTNSSKVTLRNGKKVVAGKLIN
ncbi:unnamed protein product [Allacma fusca]|uniref:Uncharacterized protein n=1 Tax=Allacma fusca TaxID=39272 RepID=A0A8J2PBR9_9HEXA|nr:unnamed protein product [Allacma fusca]